MNRIVLIGNGFDLAHGLKTSYADFIDWYWNEWGKQLLQGLNRTEDDGLCSFKIKDNIEVQNWASVFQGWYYKRENPLIPWDTKDVVSLAKQDKKLCDFKMSPFFERIQKGIECKGWVDIEDEYHNLLIEYSFHDISHQKLILLNKQLLILQKKLIQYLMTIDNKFVESNEFIRKAIYSPFKELDISIGGQHALNSHIEDGLNYDENEWRIKLYQYGRTYDSYYIERYRKEKQSGKIINEVPYELLLPNQIMLLDFNYTNTSKMYCEKPSIFTYNQIHGSLDNPDSIIFGYGDEMDEHYKKLQNLNDQECLKNIKSINYMNSDNYHKVLRLIESEPYQIFIMGHSCGNSDRTLLNTLFEHKNCTSIKPFYYIKDDGTDNYLELVQNISRNFNDMKLMRDRVVNKTYCEPLVK